MPKSRLSTLRCNIVVPRKQQFAARHQDGGRPPPLYGQPLSLLLREPRVKRRLRFDLDFSPHNVVADPAQLRAGRFKLALPVGVNDISVVMPGTASCLRRKWGTKKLWITSLDRIRSRTGRLTTRWSSRVTMSLADTGSAGSSPIGLSRVISSGRIPPNLPSGPG
ncbi:MAG TPA: hypothetical protein VGA58_00400 [bacterium]